MTGPVDHATAADRTPLLKTRTVLNVSTHTQPSNRLRCRRIRNTMHAVHLYHTQDALQQHSAAPTHLKPLMTLTSHHSQNHTVMITCANNPPLPYYTYEPETTMLDDSIPQRLPLNVDSHNSQSCLGRTCCCIARMQGLQMPLQRAHAPAGCCCTHPRCMYVQLKHRQQCCRTFRQQNRKACKLVTHPTP